MGPAAAVTTITVSTDIACPAAAVWAMVADVTRMGEWSPETVGARWVGGATGAVPGARFRGRNRHGSRSWGTLARVVEAEPGRRFAFRVTAGGLPVADWAYDFEVTSGGCIVRESWTDRRGRIAKALGGPVSGVSDRAAHNRAGMERTLERLKQAAEQSAAPR